ncbi:hypothetical protein [Paenibacillus spongiae]|uniref:Copper amine oxidase N-terminal domain-containing protein n=1 Tax=Paenibacillus spongiae TaxID=2909671 RepID=A0ABY5S727_9BACL|nr:hypothetical protein [Paenibacillus spongiae]UVI29303.1 hypothetical protein L1F29_28375 [Paenibacillus spongiae]
MRKLIPFTCLIMILLLTGAVLPPAQAQPASKGVQPMPLLIKNHFVLFPGESAPFIKNNRLMVPLQPLADIIGASVDSYTSKRGTSYTIRALSNYESVAGLREGVDWAVYETDLGYYFEAAPEMRAGSLFIPLTPILQKLYSYSYEVRTENGRKVLAIMDREQGDRPLREIIKDQPVEYPHLLADPAYPFIPLSLQQEEVHPEHNKNPYQLTLTLERTEDQYGQPIQQEFMVIAVDSSGKATERVIPWTLETGQGSSDSIVTVNFSLPSKASYVLFRAEPGSESEIIYPSGLNLELTMGRVLDKLFDTKKLFEDLDVEVMTSSIENGEMKLVVRRLWIHDQALPAEEVERIKQTLYEFAGRSFPLQIQNVVISPEPNMPGVIRSINKDGTMLIENPDRLMEDGKPEAMLIRLEQDAVIEHKGKESRIMVKDLRTGLKVDVWTQGSSVTSDRTVGKVVQMQVTVI